jgi:hypothetical protein
MTNLAVAFRNFAKAPNNDFSLFCDEIKPGIVFSYQALQVFTSISTSRAV